MKQKTDRYFEKQNKTKTATTKTSTPKSRFTDLDIKQLEIKNNANNIINNETT